MAEKNITLADLEEAQLRAELARRETEANAELSRRAAVLRERQEAFDQHVLETWKQIEAEIQEEARGLWSAAEDAVLKGDLSAAFRSYSLWHSARATRQQLHDAAQNAANRLGTVADGARIIREVNFSFSGFLETAGDKAAVHHGNTAFEQIYGAFPTTYEDVAATDPLAPAADEEG